MIFIAAPLRGSDLARNWVGRTGSTLVKVPRKLLRVGNDALRLVSFQARRDAAETRPEQRGFPRAE